MSDLPPESVEVLRAWLVGDALHCSLTADLFEDRASWGAVLADLARHVAAALEQADGSDRLATLSAIAKTFARELASPPEAE